MERPPALPEGILIRRAREAAGITVPEAAQAAGISKARWTQVETGYETRQGAARPVRAKPGTIARMAHAVGISPERMETEGTRPDAAEVLREIERQEPRPSAVPAGEPPVPGTVERVVRALLPSLPPEHRDVITGITRLTDGEGRPLSDEKKLAMIEAWVSYGQQDQGEQAGLEAPLPAVSFC